MLRAARTQEEGKARGEVRATIERLAVYGRPLPQNAPGESAPEEAGSTWFGSHDGRFVSPVTVWVLQHWRCETTGPRL